MAGGEGFRVKTHREHRHAAKRQFKRKLLQAVLFFAIIVTVTYLLKVLFTLSTNYMPSVYEPKDFDRERLIQKQNDGTGNEGEPSQPQRGHD
jgi:hypothetical protein